MGGSVALNPFLSSARAKLSLAEEGLRFAEQRKLSYTTGKEES